MTPSHIDAFKRLPSLRALYIFESAARHCNLVRAAAELGVTQGALSRHIRTLEDHIGVRLFTRTSRGFVCSARCKWGSASCGRDVSQ